MAQQQEQVCCASWGVWGCLWVEGEGGINVMHWPSSNILWLGDAVPWHCVRGRQDWVQHAASEFS